ncbi:MAG: hypothetical protein ACRD18_00200 [Terriglobia bacterium]
MIDDAANMVDGRSIPDLDRLHELGLPRHPSNDAMCFLDNPESRTPLAAVPLSDSYHMLAEARYALLEGFRQLEHYRGKEPPNELSAVFFGQFYGSDVALRLYAAGEYLAGAIIEMLEVEEPMLTPYKKKHVSLQATVAKFLIQQKMDHRITAAVRNLGTSEEWRRAIRYRDDWVHTQALLVSGMGLTFKRGKKPWQKVGPTVYTLGFGSGDQPEHTVDELLECVRVASCQFTDVLVAAADHYACLLKQAAATSSNETGIVVSPS